MAIVVCLYIDFFLFVVDLVVLLIVSLVNLDIDIGFAVVSSPVAGSLCCDAGLLQ